MGLADLDDVARVKADQAKFKGMRPCEVKEVMVVVKASSCVTVLESNPVNLASKLAMEIDKYKAKCNK